MWTFRWRISTERPPSTSPVHVIVLMDDSLFSHRSYSARGGYEDILEALMSKRANHSLSNVWGQTAFQFASLQDIDLDMLLPELPPSRGNPDLNFMVALLFIIFMMQRVLDRIGNKRCLWRARGRRNAKRACPTAARGSSLPRPTAASPLLLQLALPPLPVRRIAICISSYGSPNFCE